MGNMEQVGHTLETFAAQCHDFIKAEPGPAGRKKVVALLSQVLSDEQFVAKYVDSNDKERNILYEDPEFGFVSSRTTTKARRKAARTTTAIHGRFTARRAAKRR